MNRICTFVVTVLFVSLYSSFIFSDNNIWIDNTSSTNLSFILRDDIRDLIYLGDAGNNQLVVIDSQSLNVIRRLPLDSNFDDMTISRDNRTMAVAGGTLFFVDLVTFEKRKLTTGLDVISVAFDHDGNLILLTSEYKSLIYRYNPDTQSVMHSFGTGFDLSGTLNGYGLVKTDKEGNTLFVAERGSSPGSLYKFDISAEGPTFLDEDYPWDINSLADFIISSNYDEIYVASRPMNIIDSNTIDTIDSFEIEAYPSGIAADYNGYFIYACTSNNELLQYDISQRELSYSYNLLSEAYYDKPQHRGIAVDRSGHKAFIIHGGEYQGSDRHKVQVVELNYPFSITLPINTTEGDGVLQGRGIIAFTHAPSANLIIYLDSDDTSEVSVPASVTIPAGQTSATFDITIIDDSIADGPRQVNVSARTSDLLLDVGRISVNDNENVTLTLTAPSAVEEGDGLLVNSGTVYVNTPVGDDVVVSLRSDNVGEVDFPQEVTIPAGQTSVFFDLSVIDDNKIEGAHNVTITASVEGWNQGQGTLLITDNEVRELTVTNNVTLAEGDGLVKNGGTVTISGTLPEDLTVTLSSNDITEITVQSSVIIPASKTSATFDITVIDDTEVDGIQPVTVTATAEGFSAGVSDINVTDNESIISWIDETSSTDLTYILRDEIRDRIYLADNGNKHLVIIDSQSLQVILRLPLDSNFSDIAISKDSNTLAVAGGNLFVVNLETFESKQLSTELDVISAAFDHNGDLILMTSAFPSYIYHYDPVKETVINSFGSGVDLNTPLYDDDCRIETDEFGNILYVSERHGDFLKFDISGDIPIFISDIDYDGSVRLDFAVSSQYNEIYLTNLKPPYGIQIVDLNTLGLIHLLETDNSNSTRGVEIDQTGYYVYGIQYDNSARQGALYQFDRAKRELAYHYNLSSEVLNGSPLERGITIDRSGKRAFIIHGDSHPSVQHFKVQVVVLNIPLSISLPEGVFEGDSVLTGQGIVTVLQAPIEDLTIFLDSNDSTEVQVPASVTIPAGQTTATFDITIIDDSILDGSKSPVITASTSGYPPASSSIDVKDNETATLTLTLPNNVSEGDGLLSDQGTVSLSEPVEDDVTVRLTTDKPGQVGFPQKVTIPTGQTSVSFDLFIVDDSNIEGTHEATITALVEGWNQDQKTITITDNEAVELNVTNVVTFSEGDGQVPDSGIVTISGTFPFNREVQLSSSDTSEITVPSTVIIPAWKTSANFDITVVDDAEMDGIQWPTITASLDGFSDSMVNIAVTDNDNIVWLDDTISTNLRYILRDNVRDRIYVGDSGNDQLIVLDSNSLEVIFRLPIESFFTDMAISKDNNTLAVAGETLHIVDLETLEARKLPSDLWFTSVAFDHKGDLILVTRDQFDYIYRYDPDTETINSLIYGIRGWSLTKTDAEGKILYLADTDTTSGRLEKFDISEEIPIKIADNMHSVWIGEFLRDITLSPRYDELYVTCSYAYHRGIQFIDINTMSFLELIDTGTGYGALETDIEGYYIYGLSSSISNYAIYQVDAAKREVNFHYNLLSEFDNNFPVERGIDISRSGQRVFVLHQYGESPYVYDSVQVVELNTPFKLFLPGTVPEADNVLEGQGVITLLQTSSEDLEIFLESDNSSEVQVPSSVTVPAGQKSTSFDITVIDDQLLDGTQRVSIKCYIPNVYSTTETIHVNDNEITSLHVSLPESVREGDGTITGEGIITVDSPVDSDVNVRLFSSDESEILLPYAAIIRAGNTSATFSFTVVDDLLIDDIQTSTISANVEGWTAGFDTIEVQDDDDYLILETVLFAKEGEGILSYAGYVSIVNTIDSDLVINLSSNDTSEVTVPSTVTIPAGETSVSFDLNIPDDDLGDSTQSVIVTATASEFTSDTANISVVDNENDSIIPSWNTYQGNPSHTGYVPVKLTSSFNERWVKKLGIWLNPVTAADGRVFVSASTYTNGVYTYALLVLMAENGEIVWGDYYKNYGDFVHPNPPAYNNGIVYIQTMEDPYPLHNNIRAYNAATGSLIFTSPFSDQGRTYYAPTIYDDNVYMAGGYYGGEYAFDGLTGEKLWFNDLDRHFNGTGGHGNSYWTPAVNDNYVFAYTSGNMTDYPNELFAANRLTGEEEFYILDLNCGLHRSDLSMAPVLGAENDVLVIDSGRLISFDITQKSIKWEIDSEFRGQPSVANGKIYAISAGSLAVIDESDGSILWSWDPPEGDLKDNMIVTYNHIFAGTDDTTYAIDLETRTDIWSYPAGGHLALSEGILYIATDAGTKTETSGFLIAIDTVVDMDSDTDNDNIPDSWELVYFGDMSRDGNDDYDNDGLTDIKEYHYGTSPTTEDTDSDGMSDKWEIQYGLKPLVDDSDIDSDNDGYTNLQEFYADSSPFDNTDYPRPPVADAGEDQTDIMEGETVTLFGSNSSDPDNGIGSYFWEQIEEGPEVTLSDDTDALPTFVAPPVGEEGITLTFKLTVTDNGGLTSEDTVSVTVNDNGITGFPEHAITFPTSTDEDVGCAVVEGGDIVALDILEPSMISDTRNKPQNLIYGLMEFIFKTDATGGTVRLTIYLPSPAPIGYSWYKYSETDGWINYRSNASFNAERDQITLTLTDGGSGDDDGIANGIIIDPSGLGSAPSASSGGGSTDSSDEGGGGGGGGIFGTIDMAELVGYHLDWKEKDGTTVYMPVTDWIKALKGAQTHVEGFAPGLANYIRGTFDALERRAKSDPDGLLSKTGTYLFPIFGRVAEMYLDAVDSHELMDKAYEKTTISVDEFNNLEKDGAAISSHNVKEKSKY